MEGPPAGAGSSTSRSSVAPAGLGGQIAAGRGGPVGGGAQLFPAVGPGPVEGRCRSRRRAVDAIRPGTLMILVRRVAHRGAGHDRRRPRWLRARLNAMTAGDPGGVGRVLPDRQVRQRRRP